MILDSKFPYFFWVNKEAEELILSKSIDDLITEQMYKGTYVEGKLSNNSDNNIHKKFKY